MHIATITYCENVALVTLRNVASEGLLIGEIFTAISDHGINVDMISQTAPQGGTISLAFTVSTESVAQLLPILNGFKPAAPELGVELILVLEDGIPQGLGTHEELLKTCDAYREISTIQMGGEDL